MENNGANCNVAVDVDIGEETGIGESIIRLNINIINMPDRDIDETNYKKWTQKQVLVWLKKNLVENGFDDDLVKQFLTEFSETFVTGAVLSKFKENKELLDEFQSKFSKINQIFTLWIVVKSAIVNIGDNINSNINDRYLRYWL